MSTRTLREIVESVPASDGAGVKLLRSVGRQDRLRLDPFLMLDQFSSENPDDYVAGFPSGQNKRQVSVDGGRGRISSGIPRNSASW